MADFFVELSGVPEGGAVALRVVTWDGVVRGEVTTRAGDRLRHVARRLTRRMDELLDPRLVTVEYAGAVLAVAGALDVSLDSTDPGVTGFAFEVPRPLAVNARTVGASQAGAPPPVQEEPGGDSDTEVLQHLGRMIGSLARAGGAEARLLQSAASAQRTFVQSVRALLTGTAIPDEPNPGKGGPIVTDSDTAVSSLTGLGAHVPELLTNLANLSEARASQMKSAAAKEAEAKKGGGKSAAKPPGKTATGVPGGGTAAAAPASPEASQAPAAGPTGAAASGPGEPRDVGGLIARPLGSPEDFHDWDEADKIAVYKIRGLEIVIGHFPDGWYRERGRGSMEVGKSPDRTVATPNTSFFGDRDSTDPDRQMIKVDKDALDRMVAEEQARTQPDPWREPKEIISFGLSILPFVGTAKAALDVLAGKDIITGDELSTEVRLATALTLLLPFAGGFVKSTVRAALGNTAREIVVGGRRVLTEAERLALRELGGGLSSEARAAGKSATREIFNCEGGRCLAPPNGGPRPISCFVAGTLVATAHGLRPIEALAVGDYVWSAPHPDGPNRALRRIVATHRRSVVGTVLLTLVRGGATAVVEATPGHPVAAGAGWVGVGRLAVGMEVVCDGSARGFVKEVVRWPAREVNVFNLEVEVDRCYFVTPLAVLVHNGPCDEVAEEALGRSVTREAPEVTVTRRPPPPKPTIARFPIDAETEDLLRRHGFTDYDAVTGTATRDNGLTKLSRAPDGRYRLTTTVNGSPVTIEEYTIAPYKPGRTEAAENFFNAHHAIQDHWAETRLGKFGYDRNAAPCINLRNTRRGSPHRSITTRQGQRKATIETRTYVQERNEMLTDLRRAGVPDDVMERAGRECDEYFRGLRDALADPAQRAEMDAILGGL